MTASNRSKRATLRRNGRIFHTTLVCICGKSETFKARVDENDLSPAALFKPIDEINKAIAAAGWLEAANAPNDWCTRCRRYRKSSLRRRGYSTRGRS